MKTFEDVSIGDKLMVSHFVFPFTEQEMLIVTDKVSDDKSFKIHCETKGGARYWFSVPKDSSEFYDEQSAYENTKVEIL